MAFTYGFFNSKGLDRTYTAENFCDYLGSIICNGIQDTYGECFELKLSGGLKVTLGMGKAWINGHYFINDAPYQIDLSGYQDESLPRYVTISILLDVSESARNVSIEIVSGTPAENPSLPSFTQNKDKTRLLLYAVRINAGVSELAENNLHDYRDDSSKCGYCRCILGKCKVSEILAQLSQIKASVDKALKKVDEFTAKVSELQTRVDDLTGEITETGNLADGIYYVMYSNGTLLMKGTGDMPDYTSSDSPFRENENIRKLIIGDGITKIGSNTFMDCLNLSEVSYPVTLQSIGSQAFFMKQSGGMDSFSIPASLESIGHKAFVCNNYTEILLPETLSKIGTYAFMECKMLESVRAECPEIPDFCFVRCTNLKNMTLSRNVSKIGSNMINYCDNLKEITYEGSLSDWANVTKMSNWDGNHGQLTDGSLDKIICSDGYMKFDRNTKEWSEIKT